MASAQPTRTYNFAGGSNAVADEVDTDLNALYTVLQGGLGDTHIASDAAIAWTKMAGTALTDWTSTWTSSGGTAPAIGNGTVGGEYIQYGKMVFGTLKFNPGSTSTYGSGTNNWRFTLPVTPVTDASNNSIIGPANVLNQGVKHYTATVFIPAGQTYVNIIQDQSTSAGIGDGVPFAWVAADSFTASFAYEAA